jgi:hypothetical protein
MKGAEDLLWDATIFELINEPVTALTNNPMTNGQTNEQTDRQINQQRHHWTTTQMN